MKSKIFQSNFNTFFGDIKLYADDNYLLFVELPKSSQNQKLKNTYETEIVDKKNQVLLKAGSELEEYFKGKLRSFSTPLNFEYEKPLSVKVYKILRENVPFGELIAYKNLSDLSNIKNGARFIGNLMANNKFPIFIPCHRVIKSNGEVGGYSASSNIKLKLINFERMCLSK